MDGYILDLRKIVGKRTLIQCAASVLIIDSEGRLLLGKRSDNGLWAYAGGSVEIDEPVEDCARRELYEEMSLEADELTFFMINSGPEAHYIYPNGDEVSNVEIIYTCRSWQGDPGTNDGELTGLRFFAPSEITEEMVTPSVRPVIRKFLETSRE